MKAQLIILHMFFSSSLLAQPVLQETQGWIYLEAEQFVEQTQTEKRSWVIVDETAEALASTKASGKAYVECRPDTRITHDDKLIEGENFSNYPGKIAILSYRVNFQTLGRYYVWVRTFSNGSEDNSVHVGIDGQWPSSGQRMQWCEGKNNWTWASKQRTAEQHCGVPHQIHLDVAQTGEHLIQFSMREDGFKMDKILLTTQRDFNPSAYLMRSEIYIRDPFIFPDTTTHTYYMYSSANQSSFLPDAVNGVVVYKSKDLEHWEKPQYVFKTPPNWWASDQHGVWAPEVHAYQGKYYLFATFTHPDRPLGGNNPSTTAKVRGTAILVADSLHGPFVPLSDQAQTPQEWMALDGTLFLERGKPYLVFCHEWIQIEEGTIQYQKLSPDLSTPLGKPSTLFKAKEAPWVERLVLPKQNNASGYITDGPWFYRTQSGKLLMLWSSFGKKGYTVGVASSKSGRLKGPWAQQEPLFEQNGGHAMIFKTFAGKLILTLHQPNSGDIRARFFALNEIEDRLVLQDIIPFK